MQSSEHASHDSLEETKELLSTPYAVDILLHLLKHGQCSEKELRDGACDGKSPEKALEFLTGKGLIESEGGKIGLTCKGEKAAGIISRIEGLFSEDQY